MKIKQSLTVKSVLVLEEPAPFSMMLGSGGLYGNQVRLYSTDSFEGP